MSSLLRWFALIAGSSTAPGEGSGRIQGGGTLSGASTSARYGSGVLSGGGSIYVEGRKNKVLLSQFNVQAEYGLESQTKLYQFNVQAEYGKLGEVAGFFIYQYYVQVETQVVPSYSQAHVIW